MADRRRAARGILAAGLALALLVAPSAGADGPCVAGTGIPSLDLSLDDGGDSGIGGTGLRDGGDDSGIGGTGLSGEESGIGGTGLVASGVGGTGIFGTITAFGSVCVNGLRVRYADDVAIEMNGAAGSAADLAVGQVVWIEAESDDAGLEARRIEIHSAVVGPVRRVDLDRGTVEVLDLVVEVPTEAVLVDLGASGLADLAPGDVVDVGGLRRAGGAVVASRLARLDRADVAPRAGPRLSEILEGAPPLERLSVEGYVSERVGRERLRIDRLELDVTDVRDALRDVRTGARVRAFGRVTRGGALRVERSPARPTRPETPVRDLDRRVERPEVIERPEKPVIPVRPVRPTTPERIDRVLQDVQDVRELQAK